MHRLERRRLVLTEKPSELIAFAAWLHTARKARGYTQERLSELSSVDQGLISKYERAILQCPKPTVRALGIALCPEDADEHTARALLNAGLKAAGFAGLDDEITYIPNPAERTLLERYNNSDEAGRRLIDETAEMAAERAALRASRAGAIGGKWAGD